MAWKTNTDKKRSYTVSSLKLWPRSDSISQKLRIKRNRHVPKQAEHKQKTEQLIRTSVEKSAECCDEDSRSERTLKTGWLHVPSCESKVNPKSLICMCVFFFIQGPNVLKEIKRPETSATMRFFFSPMFNYILSAPKWDFIWTYFVEDNVVAYNPE